MDYYDSKDFNSMQEEAIRRVQEMQRRSKNLVNGTTSQKPGHSEPENPVHPQTSGNRQNGHNSNSLNGLLGGLFGGSSKSGQEKGVLFNIGGIKIDEEKALIALMIYILYKNGADVKLLLGLGYLLI